MEGKPFGSFEDMESLNPWTVRVDDGAGASLLEDCDENPVLEGVLRRLLKELETFPPNEKWFKETKRSLLEGGIWLTLSEGHLRIRLFVEYRRHEGVCWVVKALVDVTTESASSALREWEERTGN